MLDLLMSASPWLLASETGGWRLLGRLHPLAVHFPIALVLLAALLEIVGAFRPQHRTSTSATTCMAFGAIGAALAAWFGWLNAAHEAHAATVQSTITAHRWVGIGAAAAAWAAVLLVAIHRLDRRDRQWPVAGYRAATLVAAVLVGIGGHLGGVLVYGSDYLTAVLPWREAAPAAAPVESGAAMIASEAHDAAPGEPSEFETAVRPILETRCASCHGPRRQRGDLRLVPISAALALAPDRAVIVPGAAERSLLVQRIRLPVDDPDRMPADGAPLSPLEIDHIARWIADGCPLGASGDVVSAAPPAIAPPPPTPGAAPPTPAVSASARAARRTAMTAIARRGGTAVPLAAGRDELDVNLSLAAPPITDQDLEVLDGLEAYLVRLSLARSEITSAGLSRLARFTRIRRLRLDRCAIDDAGLAELRTLQQVTHLNLYGTRVGDAGLRTLAELGALRSVSLWQTDVTEEGVSWLRGARPDLDVLVGTTAPVTEVEAGEDER